MQADPFVQAPSNLQNYNRYSYVLNNPMSYTDPSGYLWDKISKPFKRAGRSFIRGATRVFGTELVSMAGSLASVACGPAAGACAAAWNYEFTRAMGGTSSQAFKAGVIAGMTAQAFYEIGQHFSVASAQNVNDVVFGGAQLGDYIDFGGNLLTKSQVAAQIAAHASVGGISSVANGGQFGHGFISAGITKGAGGAFLPGGSGLEFHQIAKGTIISAVIGGTVSEITGGKFANGARTGAMQYVLNQVSESWKQNFYGSSHENKKSEIIELSRELAGEASNNIDMSGAVSTTLPDWLYKMVRGYKIHREFSRLIDSTGIDGYRGEGPSYLLGFDAPWATSGSSRPDATWGPVAEPHLAFELKTGIPIILPYQKLQYEKNLPSATELILIMPATGGIQ
ncbi:hypothetical protein J8M21_25825 [Pseudoalteromonas luteoviolacea]|nr:hypothetical protein [Pseudoalteromonas luteoviolacea]MBQ4909663.1 hypothetical protein [Pseudoalteromonas luteoviolacea]